VKWRIALIVAAVGTAVLPIPPRIVEEYYSTPIYPAAQTLITRASNLVPIALFDVLIVALAGGWIAWTLQTVTRRTSWLRALAGIGVRTVVWAAALYMVFACVWGLNYRRIPLVEKLPFDAARVTPEAARDLARIAVGEINSLYAAAHAALPDSAPSQVDATLAAAFAGAQRDLGAARLATPARPKSTILDLYFERAGVAGMTDPFFLETLIADDLLPVERPFVVAHEWSHLAGITDEGEANFAGWLTCLRGAPAHRYSGWLFLFGELSRAMRGADRVVVVAGLAPGPRDDLRAIARRIEQHVNPRVATVGWRVYDEYLKANRIERGAASYAEVVKLVLGVRFDEAWVPRR
jgi:hypothetical protein